MQQNQLIEIARAEIEEIMARLPKPLQDRARQLPVCYDRVPRAALVADGIDEETLGLFVGEEYAEEGLTVAPLPAQIILFLANIWEYADADEGLFRDEVRTTYLHELGHYLGLDEIDLDDRGLA